MNSSIYDAIINDKLITLGSGAYGAYRGAGFKPLLLIDTDNQDLKILKRPANKNWNTAPAADFIRGRSYGMMPPVNILVLDVDVKNNAPGMQSLDKLKNDLRIPDGVLVPHVLTPSGGAHYYCYYDFRIKFNDKYQLPFFKKQQPRYPGIDFINCSPTDGAAYVVAGGQSLGASNPYLINPAMYLTGTDSGKFKLIKGINFHDGGFLLTKMPDSINYPEVFTDDIKTSTETTKLEANDPEVDELVDQVRKCLKWLPVGLPSNQPIEAESYDFDNYNRWLEVGMALANSSLPSDVALSLWHEWSSKSDKYDSKILDYKWNTFKNDKNNNITIATLIYHAKYSKWNKLLTYLTTADSYDEYNKRLSNDEFINEFTEYPFIDSNYINNNLKEFLNDRNNKLVYKVSSNKLDNFIDKLTTTVEDVSLDAILRDPEFKKTLSNYIVLDISQSRVFYALHSNEKMLPTSVALKLKNQLDRIKKTSPTLLKKSNKILLEYLIDWGCFRVAQGLTFDPEVKDKLIETPEELLKINTFQPEYILQPAPDTDGIGYQYLKLFTYYLLILFYSVDEKADYEYNDLITKKPGDAPSRYLKYDHYNDRGILDGNSDYMILRGGRALRNFIYYIYNLTKNPALRGQYAPFLYGGKGIGKTTFFYIIANALVGSRYSIGLKSDFFSSKFNSKIRANLFAYIDEIKHPSHDERNEYIDNLTRMIGAREIITEGKHENQIIEKNYLTFIAAANNYPTYFPDNERRIKIYILPLDSTNLESNLISTAPVDLIKSLPFYSKEGTIKSQLIGTLKMLGDEISTTERGFPYASQFKKSLLTYYRDVNSFTKLVSDINSDLPLSLEALYDRGALLRDPITDAKYLFYAPDPDTQVINTSVNTSVNTGSRIENAGKIPYEERLKKGREIHQLILDNINKKIKK